MMDGQVGLRYPWDVPPEEGEAIEVAEGVFWLRFPLPMALDHVNVYALDEGDGWTVIDTGFDSRRSRAIWEKVLAGPLGGKPVTRLIVTHHHPDHVGLAGWFQERGAELWMTRTAWLMARMLQLDTQAMPTPEMLDFWRKAGMRPDIYEERASQRPFNFSDVVHPLPLGFRRMHQGEVIRIGGRDWDMHVGHGHAPAHATFWSRDDNLVIAGDQILSTISSNIGVHATEPEADPVGEWLESCERLATLAHEGHLVLGGHKLPFTGLPFRMRQLIDNHHHALDRLEAYLDTPKSAAECFAPLFKREIDGDVYGMAMVESVAHLVHLHQHGRVTRSLREDGAYVYQQIG